jgi:hypothetical protein
MVDDLLRGWTGSKGHFCRWRESLRDGKWNAYFMALIMTGYGWLCMVGGMAFGESMILEGRTPLPGFWSVKIYSINQTVYAGIICSAGEC